MIGYNMERKDLIAELSTQKRLREVLDCCLTYHEENAGSEFWEQYNQIGIQPRDIRASPEELSRLCELGILKQVNSPEDGQDHYRITDLETAQVAVDASSDLLSEFIQDGPLEGQFQTSIKPFSECERVDQRELPVIDAVCWESDSQTAWILESRSSLTTASAATAFGRLLLNGEIFEQYEMNHRPRYEKVRLAAVFGDGWSFSTHYQMEVFTKYGIRAYQNKGDQFERVNTESSF